MDKYFITMMITCVTLNAFVFDKYKHNDLNKLDISLKNEFIIKKESSRNQKEYSQCSGAKSNKKKENESNCNKKKGSNSE